MKRLIGVGVGPGDPELVTVKAVRVLREADVVLVPVLASPDPGPAGVSGPGRAETIIRAYVGADRVKRLEFALNDTGGVTPRRAAAWQAAAAAVAEEFAAGAATIAFGTLGDPNLYSTFSYLAQTVRDLVPEVTVETVAGITAMQDLASRAGISLAEGTEPVTLVPLNGGVSALDQALARGGTVVGYKVGAAASPAPADPAGPPAGGRPPGRRRHRRPPRPRRRANRPRRRPPAARRCPPAARRCPPAARRRPTADRRGPSCRAHPRPTSSGHSGYSVFVHPYRARAPQWPGRLPGSRGIRQGIQPARCPIERGPGQARWSIEPALRPPSRPRRAQPSRPLRPPTGQYGRPPARTAASRPVRPRGPGKRGLWGGCSSWEPGPGRRIC